MEKPAIGTLGTDKEGLGVAAGGAAGKVLVDIGAAVNADVLVGTGEIDPEVRIRLGEGVGDGAGRVTWTCVGSGIENVDVAAGHREVYRRDLEGKVENTMVEMTPSATTGVLTILPDPPPPPTPIGLIAGGGQLPVIIARSLKQAGHVIHCLGLSGQWEPELPGLCDTFREVGVLKIGSWGKLLSKIGVQHAIMVGKVDKAKLMYDPLRLVRNLPDMAAIAAWYRHLRNDRRSHALLSAIAEELDRSGVALIDSTAPIDDELATPGVMTKRQPSPAQIADYEFAWPMLMQVMRLDIGQAVAVRERDIIAVEAVEGTDRMIQRAGQLCKAKGWTLCKGARPGHDRRSDVPTIGVRTIENLHAAGSGCLALAAGDCIMIEKQRVLDAADRLGISIVGIPTAFS